MKHKTLFLSKGTVYKMEKYLSILCEKVIIPHTKRNQKTEQREHHQLCQNWNTHKTEF